MADLLIIGSFLGPFVLLFIAIELGIIYGLAKNYLSTLSVSTYKTRVAFIISLALHIVLFSAGFLIWQDSWSKIGSKKEVSFLVTVFENLGYLIIPPLVSWPFSFVIRLLANTVDGVFTFFRKEE